MSSFDERIAKRVDDVLTPFFRGYYSQAFATARDLAQSTCSGKTAGLEKDVYETLGLFATVDRNVDGAVTRGLELVKTARESPGLSKRERVFYSFYGLMLAGWAESSRRGRRQLDKAISHLSLAIRLRESAVAMDYHIPGAWTAYHFRGWSYYNQGHISLAIQDLNRGVLAANTYVAALQNRGIVNRDMPSARRFLSREMKPLARLLATRAMLFYELGDFNNAREDVYVAMEIDPLNPYVRGWAGVIQFGMNSHLESLQELFAAKELYEQEGQPSSGRPEYFLNLFSYQCRREPATVKTLPASAKAFLESAGIPGNIDLTETVVGKLLDTRRTVEAVSCLLIGLDPLGADPGESAESDFGRRMIFHLLSAIDGIYDYIGNRAVHDTRALSLLTRNPD